MLILPARYSLTNKRLKTLIMCILLLKLNNEVKLWIYAGISFIVIEKWHSIVFSDMAILAV